MTQLCRILFWLGLACILAGGQAHAHATLVEAVPADGAVIETVPSELRLRFNEPVSPVIVHLIDAKGTQRRDIRVEARDATLTIHLPTDLPRGTQVVSYRVISSDGHPVGGALVFSIGTATAAPSPEASSVDWRLASSLWLGRLALYLGLFTGVGGVFFAVWVARGELPRAARSVILMAIGEGLLATVLSVGLQGLDALDAPFPALLSGLPWAAGAQTSFGLTAVAAVLALLCAWGADRVQRLRHLLSLLSLGGAGLALALSGHASVAEPQWLTRPSVFVHGMAVAFWVGALMPLALVVWKQREASLPVVRRFSAIAIPMVAAMVLAGTVLSIVQIETPSALATTAYGRVFLAKMAAVAGLLLLAGLNRQRLTPALATGPAGSRRLIRSIAAELGLAIVILSLVAIWRFTPPPRALAAAEPVSIHIHTAPAMADLTLSPGRTGPVQVSMAFMTGDFGPLDPKEVTLTLANPAAGIEPLERRARRAGDGTWRVDRLVVPTPGRWRVRVDALISDFEKASLEGDVDVRP